MILLQFQGGVLSGRLLLGSFRKGGARPTPRSEGTGGQPFPFPEPVRGGSGLEVPAGQSSRRGCTRVHPFQFSARARRTRPSHVRSSRTQQDHNDHSSSNNNNDDDNNNTIWGRSAFFRAEPPLTPGSWIMLFPEQLAQRKPSFPTTTSPTTEETSKVKHDEKTKK